MKRALIAALAAAPAAHAENPAEIDAALARVAGLTAHPLTSPTAAERSRLARGECVTRLEAGATHAVGGLCVVNAPLPAVWLAVHDPAVTGDPAVREVRLSVDPDGSERWYGRMSLPSPLSDRAWVVRTWISASLHAATGGGAQERAWVEEPDPAALAAGVPGAADGAVWVPRNRGAWTVIRVDDRRTLLAYRAETVVGGSLPQWVVRDVARRSVGALLDRVARAAKG
jgi:hypothetical protein